VINAAEAHAVITFVRQQYLHIVMYLVEGQSVIYGEMVVVVAEVGVTMCAEVHMFMKTIIPRRHAQSCKGKSSSEDRWFESTSKIKHWIQIQWSWWTLVLLLYLYHPFCVAAVVLTSFI
jgi:hypothetical protein